MAYVKKLFNENFLQYASYVIKDRAIPDIADGLKPVQRRILHSLFEMDDGKFHKVANVVGHCMKYHPHGDQSIGGALVTLANKGLFIDRQGNFGNMLTGDEASAARYIECRATSLAKEVFHNPKTTRYADSYDGRNREPEVFPAKLPVVLMMGAEGIAVGMSTKILPHNPVEVIRAEIAFLQGKQFRLLPDFPTGGLADVSEYADGNGRVRVRARLDTSDPKRILVTEIPFGSTTESLIASVEAAARSGRIKIASISDFTTDRVEIEIRLQRGVYAQEVIDALYAFTECEQPISCNCLVIKDEKPLVTTVSEIVRNHAGSLLSILRSELEIELGELREELHERTLERIFIEERIYKAIESRKTKEAVVKAVHDGLAPFAAEISRAVTDADVERLLQIPIRRISLYDIEKARGEMRAVEARIAEANAHLAALVEYAVSFLKGLAKKLEAEWPRRTETVGFSKVDVREAARRDIALRYDAQAGYIGTAVSSGDRIMEVSAFDRILVVRRNGIYTVVPVTERMFVDRGLLWCAVAEKESVGETLFTVVYRAGDTGFPHVKRCRIAGWIVGKDYSLIPEGAQLLMLSTEHDFDFTVTYAPKPRTKTNSGRFKAGSFPEKGLKAAGVRLATRDAVSADSTAARRGPTGPAEPELAEDGGGALGSDTNGSARQAKAIPAQPVAVAAKPAAKSAAKSAARAIARPATKSATKPAAEPAAKPVAKPASEPTAKPAAKPASEPAAKPAAKSATEPAPKASKTAAELPLDPAGTEQPAGAKEPDSGHDGGGGLLAALARKKAELEHSRPERDLFSDEPEDGK